MKKRTTMLMSALFAAGAFALNGNVAKADNVQAVNNNNANSTEVKQNTVNADSSKLNVASAQTNNQADTKIPSKEELKDIAMKQYNEYVNTPLNARKDYDVAVWDRYSTGLPIFVDNAVLGGKDEDPNAIRIHQSQLKTYDWTPVNNELNAAKESLTSYLNKAVEKDNTSLESSRKEASDNLKKINLPQNGELVASDEWHAVEDDPTVQKARNNTGALGAIWETMQNPYLATLIGSRTALEESDYKNEEGFYSDKLAELVARNIKKDKNWILANTNPKTIKFGMPGTNPEIKQEGASGEGFYQPEVKYETVLPYFIYNKELIKVDRDAYNRNNDIKSDENTSANKNQSTTDAKKDQASQNVTDNATSKKDQSSEKVTNDTTSKKDQSTTSTSNTSSSNTNQTTESKSSTTSSKTTSDTKTPVAKNEGSNTKTTAVVKNDTKAATEKTNDVKVIAPSKDASNEVKTTDVAAKASDAHVVALNSKVNAGTTSTTPAAAKGSQSKATENKLPQAGTDEKISLFASLAGLSIASLGLGALGASKKRKND